jgi:hypothetical protein
MLIILSILTLTAFVKNQTPATFFGMDIYSGVLSTQPWPSVPMDSIRLWDTYTSWSDLEPSNGVYTWSNLDAYLALAQTNNVDVLCTFGGTPNWAVSGSGSQCAYSTGSCYPPAKIQDWDNFVSALAARSSGRIKHWELWNEADLAAFWTGDMPTLLLMAQHAYKIIKDVPLQLSCARPPLELQQTWEISSTCTFWQVSCLILMRLLFTGILVPRRL